MWPTLADHTARDAEMTPLRCRSRRFSTIPPITVLVMAGLPQTHDEGTYKVRDTRPEQKPRHERAAGAGQLSEQLRRADTDGHVGGGETTATYHRRFSCTSSTFAPAGGLGRSRRSGSHERSSRPTHVKGEDGDRSSDRAGRRCVVFTGERDHEWHRTNARDEVEAALQGGSLLLYEPVVLRRWDILREGW